MTDHTMQDHLRGYLSKNQAHRDKISTKLSECSDELSILKSTIQNLLNSVPDIDPSLHPVVEISRGIHNISDQYLEKEMEILPEDGIWHKENQRHYTEHRQTNIFAPYIRVSGLGDITFNPFTRTYRVGLAGTEGQPLSGRDRAIYEIKNGISYWIINSYPNEKAARDRRDNQKREEDKQHEELESRKRRRRKVAILLILFIILLLAVTK